MRSSVFALIALAIGLAASSCSFWQGSRAPGDYPADLQAALEASGDNRPRLEAVLRHCRTGADSLKLEAARFLIANMEQHSFARLCLCDSLEEEVALDVLAYPDYTALRAAIDSIEAVRGELSYRRDEIIPDLEAMSDALLIENIDYAFRAWRERPWARHYSFAEFRDYVLPYRGSNEPLESWRPFFFERYHDLADRMEDPTDPIEAARLINADLITWFTFDERFYLHPTDQGLSEMRACGLGRCEDMTNLAIYAMRANGLPVTSDYTPFWANAGNNHAWNAILDRDGRVLSFMGCEAHPGEYRLWNKLAKAYRKTYAPQPGNLAFQKHEDEQVPAWLSGKYYEDVTAAYTEVADMRVTLSEVPDDSVRFAYLCVFNSGDWEAIHWGRIEDGAVVFEDMGTGIAYLPAFYLEQELVPAAGAFVLEKSGLVRPLAADPARQETMILRATTRAVTVSDTDSIEKSFLEEGRTYELHYWDDGWVRVGRGMAGDEPLRFETVPADGLYWLVAEGSREDERIFTYEEDTQIWW